MRCIESPEQLLQLKADAFVLDENLPLISGHIICIYLRSKPETAHVPLVLTSSHPQLETFAELCNADAWISKPFDQLDFLQKIEKVLKRRAHYSFSNN